ncbi:MAG TPA: IPT/TIG domain-containing protein [Bryobacteraceae bacterium]|nr:IPT/TIG domain-containing protein [Bryobacteraceae bacterium]
MRSYAKILLCLAASIPADAQVISAVAGTGMQGYRGDGGAAADAWISMTTGIAFDSAGNLYFADNGNRVVRQVNTSGIINTFAGNFQLFFGNNGDGGPATNAILGFQSSVFYGLAADKSGNLYISDSSNGIGRVRKVNSSGIISTYAGGASPISGGDGGPATSAGLMTAAGLAVDSQGNLYIADTVGERIRKVNTAGIISTVAGTGAANYSGDGGPAVNATLSVPVGVAVDAQGNLYITEKGNVLYGPRVRKVDTSGNISTVAGNGKTGFAGDGGSALNAEFGINLQGIAVDNAGNIYIADSGNGRIRKVDTSGNITSITGNGPGGSSVNGGPASNAHIGSSGLVVNDSGNLYIADSANIWKITFGAIPPGLSVSAGSLYFAGRSGPLFTIPPQSVSTSTTGPAISYTASAATTSGGAWMSLNGNPSISGTTPATIEVSINTTPGGVTLAVGTYQGTITFTPTTPGYNTPATVAVTMVISTTIPSPAPVITGVVNGASFQASQTFAPNTYVTIQGTNLASTPGTWNDSIVGGQLPTSLNGVTVSFPGGPGYISYVSPTQINVLAPPGAGSAGQLHVNNNGAISNGLTVGSAPASPAFFELSGNQVIATRLDYTYAAKNGTIPGLATTPAKPGDVLILWGTGFGVATPAAPAGVVTPSGQTYSAADPVTVTINGVQATVYGTALTAGLAGVYQVAIQVPQTLANGDWELVATTQDGFSSATGVILTVHN